MKPKLDQQRLSRSKTEDKKKTTKSFDSDTANTFTQGIFAATFYLYFHYNIYRETVSVLSFESSLSSVIL